MMRHTFLLVWVHHAIAPLVMHDDLPCPPSPSSLETGHESTLGRETYITQLMWFVHVVSPVIRIGHFATRSPVSTETRLDA